METTKETTRISPPQKNHMKIDGLSAEENQRRYAEHLERNKGLCIFDYARKLSLRGRK